MKKILKIVVKVLGWLAIGLSLPLLFVGYWTLFLPKPDNAKRQQVAENRLAPLEFPVASTHKKPILIVHGLWAGNDDGKSVCAEAEGPFSQETLMLNQQYIPLGDLGEWLEADGYQPYYVRLTTAPDYTASLQANGRCMDQQLHNLLTRINSKPGEKYTVIGHSMGGLVARACLAQSEFCRSVIDTLITMGTPHNGAAAFYTWKTGQKDCAADPGFCEMADQKRIQAFNAQAPNLPGIHYVFIGGTWGIMDRAVHFLRQNDGVVGAWSAIGMIFNAQGQPEFADWVKPNPPHIYFVANKHIFSRRDGYAYYEAPAPNQVSDAYRCIRYELGKLTEQPAVCKPPALADGAP